MQGVATIGTRDYRATMPERCRDCTVRGRSLCGTLSTEAAEAFDRITRPVDLAAGETFVWEEDDAPIVGSLTHGLLKITGSLEDGREQILGLLMPGDFVGRPFGLRSSYSVTAIAPSRLCVLGRAAFESFARDFPEVEHALLLRTLDDLDRARRWMLLLGRKSAAERVASLLVDFAARAQPGEDVAFPLTRQQMADLLGLTIETVSRQLTRLRTSGLISLTDLRHFRIANPDRLMRIAA